MKDRISKYGLIENQDYVTFSQNSEKGRPQIEYALSIDCAKNWQMAGSKSKSSNKYKIYYCFWEVSPEYLVFASSTATMLLLIFEISNYSSIRKILSCWLSNSESFSNNSLIVSE